MFVINIDALMLKQTLSQSFIRYKTHLLASLLWWNIHNWGILGRLSGRYLLLITQKEFTGNDIYGHIRSYKLHT